MTAPEPTAPAATEGALSTDGAVTRGELASVRRRRRPYLRHGLGTLKRAVRVLGSRTLDGRTRIGKALLTWRKDIAQDLGGTEHLSAQQRALLDEAVKLKLMLDSIDGFVLAMPSLVNKAKRSLLPIVKERLALVAQLQSLLRDLGLERRSRELPSLATYLAKREPPAATDGSERGCP